MESLFYLHLCALASLAFAKDIPNLTAQAASMRETVPASVITPAPVLHGDIFKRSLATCGYVRGNSGTRLSKMLISRSNRGDSIAFNMPRKLQLHDNCAHRVQLWMLQQHRVRERLGNMPGIWPDGLYGLQSGRCPVHKYSWPHFAMVCSNSFI